MMEDEDQCEDAVVRRRASIEDWEGASSQRRTAGMNEWTIRLIVALIFAAILAYQARGAVGRPMTRRAYTLGATAFLAFAALNLALATGTGFGIIQIVLGILAVGLLFYAVVSLLMGARAGEMRRGQESAAKMIEEFKRRSERREEG
jgi:hypothetical protein